MLLAGAYALGTVNRFREGGWRHAVYAPSGLAGAALFLGLGAARRGHLPRPRLARRGRVAWSPRPASATAYAGLLAAAGGGVRPGPPRRRVELFDLVVRLGSNVVSFARLAAFGLTHAALGAVVWQATSALWRPGSGSGRAAPCWCSSSATR